MGQSDKSSSTNTVPWKELLAFFGVAIAAYIGYLGIRSQTEIPIQATQTAEARLANQTQSPSLPTVASNETLLVPTDASIGTLTVQSTSVTIVAATQLPTLMPITPTVTSQQIVCVTALRGEGVPAEVQTDSFIYVPVIGSPGMKLILANGVEFLFRNMKSFEVIEVSENPYRVKVTITLHDSETITDYIGSDQAYWEHLEGRTKYGSFSMQLSKVKRVEFRDGGGCQK